MFNPHQIFSRNGLRKVVMLLMTLVFFESHSQCQKGSIMLGATGNYFRNVRETEDSQFQTSTTTLEGSTIRLNAGLFLADRHLLGISLQFQLTNYHNATTSSGVSFSESNHYEKPGIGLFYRYYVPLKGNRLWFFIQGEGLYLTASGESSNSQVMTQTTSKGSGYSAGIRPGLSFAINNKIALEFSLGYFGYSNIDYQNENGSETWKTSDSGLSAGFSLPSLFIGLSFCIGSKDEDAK